MQNNTILYFDIPLESSQRGESNAKKYARLRSTSTMKSYTCQPEGLQFTNDMKEDYDENGYIIIRGLFTGAEVKHIEESLKTESYTGHTYAVNDGKGREVEMVLWSHPGNDVTGMVARCEKVVSTTEKLLGGEVYHYHSKLMMKPPNTGGQHLWHQDYGYFYNYGFLRPDMLTVFIAVDNCVKENGCLQILKGSHKVGRVDHSLTAGQLGVSDIDRVDELKKTCPLEYVELAAGDAVFFHCNLFHCSSNNMSNHRRWALLTAYNKAENKMLHEPTANYKLGHGTPLQKVPNSAILACQTLEDKEGKDFVLVKNRPHPSRAVGKDQATTEQ